MSTIKLRQQPSILWLTVLVTLVSVVFLGVLVSNLTTEVVRIQQCFELQNIIAIESCVTPNEVTK